MGEPGSTETERVREVIAGRYRVERLLGAGGMGSVHAVVDLTTGAALALKRLASQSSEQTRLLFEREYETLAQLQHPNIVAVYDYGIDAGTPFYTMELVDGRELTQLSPMPWRAVCRCLRDVAEILAFLHARRLLHRDLSPRNLLSTAGDRLKLIDFGALASFGQPAEVVGTPPFLAPEALAGNNLDQRTDLFSLGALGYWLLTGVHAFPARNLSELSELHEHPAHLVSRILSSEGDDAPPAQLEALLAALLSLDVNERPNSAAVVVDRLNAIAELESAESALSIRGYFVSGSFVGRQDELRAVEGALAEAQVGHGGVLMIESAEGLGRTRLLRQLALRARLRGALTLSIDARDGAGAYAGSSQLLLALLDALPLEARQAIRPWEETLARTSEQVRARLGLQRDVSADGAPGELRVKVQLAIRDLLHQLSEKRCIVLLADDVHLLDDETQSVLVTLATGSEQRRLLVIATVCSAVSRTAALSTLRELSTTLALASLTSSDTLLLLRSIFGEAVYLARCAERLWRTSAGNPAHCLELAQQLVETKLARHVDGAWRLPAELFPEQLPSSREEAQLARLTRVSAEARSLAERLSIPHDDPPDLKTCSRLLERGEAETESALRELIAEGVLVRSSTGYAFVHASTRAALFVALSPTQRARTQALLARVLRERVGGDGLAALRAALQFMRAGEREQALPLLKQAGAYYGTGQAASLASLPRAAPLFEEAYALLKAEGAPDHELALALGTLALSSYFVDRRYEAGFGEPALAVYRRLLHLDLAERLSRWLGKTLALLCALLVAYVTLSRRRHAASLKQTIADFASASAALSGTGTALLAPGLSRRYADALAPFAPLGKNHSLNVVHDTSVLYSMLVSDRIAETSRGIKVMLGRLSRGEVLRDIPEGRRNDYTAGLYLSLGVQACWKGDDEVLRIADKLEKFSPIHAMMSDHFRGTYHANQGNLALAEQYRQRVEVHAVQLGHTWQVELWAPVDAAKTAMRLNDPLLIRHSFQDLSRLAQEYPSMAVEERRARGTYLMLIGHHAKAVPLLEMEEEPRAVIGWTFTRGALARAHNGLGQHARAKAVCQDALERSEPGDDSYPVLNLHVQIELARAESGLGNHAAAATLLERLLEQHAPERGALTMGALHEARAWCALQEGSLELCREHLTQMDGWYRPTGIASLIERIHELSRALSAAEKTRAGVTPSELPAEQRAARLAARLRSQSAADPRTLALAALDAVLELTSAVEAFFFLPEQDPQVLQRPEQPASAELTAWAARAWLAAHEDEQTEVATSALEQLDPFTLWAGSRRYRALELPDERGSRSLLGLLVLGFEGAGKLPAPEELRILAAQLGARALVTASTG